jgi:phosphatidylglycerol---prolipoprotein diacylglyceryl transferase
LATIEHPLIYPEYALSVLIALAVGALFPVMQDIRQRQQRRQYIKLQIITLIGAAVGCKIAVLFGEMGWRWPADDTWIDVLLSGRSILGALIFGLLAAEIAKRLIGYKLPPNDRFAAVLPFTLAIGRVGCLLHGCCRGIEYHGPFAITYSDGIPRYPIAAYEIIFDVIVGSLFVWIARKRAGRGQLFSVFLLLYGIFRFFTEFIRETPKFYGRFSNYQLLSCAAIVIAIGFLIFRSRASSDEAVTAPELATA